MKAYRSILITAIILLGMVAFIVMPLLEEDSVQEPIESKATDEKTITPMSTEPSLPFKSTIVPGKPDEVVIAERRAKGKLKQLLKDSLRAKKMFSLAEAQKDPVKFYAQVVDQYGDSVEGVRVWVGLGGVYGSKGQVSYTDAEGRFSVQGASATSMGADEMEKPGYEFNLGGIYFRSYVRKGENNRVWSDYTQEDPFVYHAWKIGEPAWLIYERSKGIRLKPNTTYTFKFDRQDIAKEGRSEGDLQVTINRAPGVRERDTIDWSISIEAVDGGLVETDDPFVYEAPEVGYQSVWQKQYTQVTGSHRDTRKFYIKTRNGKIYGYLKMTIFPLNQSGDDMSGIRLAYSINSNSSPNLYYSSRMRIYLQ